MACKACLANDSHAVPLISGLACLGLIRIGNVGACPHLDSHAYRLINNLAQPGLINPTTQPARGVSMGLYRFLCIYYD